MYCPPNVTLAEVWVDHGISQCFMETISAVVIGGFLLIFGIIQIYMYKRYGTELISNFQLSKWYHVQLFFVFLVPILALTRFLLQVYMFEKGNPNGIYGYMKVALVVNLLVFPLSAYLMRLERRFLLPAVLPRGHGFVLLVFWAMVFFTENLSFLNINKDGWWWHLKNVKDYVEMGLFVGRYVSCLMIFILGMKAPGLGRDFELLDQTVMEESRSTFRNVLSKLRTLLPFLWPKKSLCLQIYVFICVLALIAGRAVNLAVPIYNKMIVDSLSIPPLQYRWDYVLLYVLFKFLQGGGTGGMGFLNNLRSFLWIRVQQYTTRELQLELFKHLHDLPLSWHLSRKTGEVLRVMDRGTDSIDNLLSYILFSIAPTLIDIMIAVVYFVMQFNMWFGLIVFSTMILYIFVTIMVTEWRTKFQRRMNLADNEQKARSVDSLLNFETVKYYGAEGYEVASFREAILNYQKEEFKSLITLNMLNTLQNIIICGGLLAGSLLCVSMVVNTNTLTVGDYVLFASYIVQLYVPLNWFGTYYRAIQKNFIDMENMFDLMRVESDVRDAPDAQPLALRRSAFEFKDVSFGYQPDRLVLQHVSFKVAPGTTVALVGPSGSGKSTIVRLLFRFYDVNAGAVLVDERDVRRLQQAALRRAIGVVPQDTVLFNNSVRYNIQYGRLDAPEADVIAAAKNADIHDRILSFPDGYDTQVGERGLRLSGGEKQRIAIARTLLKDPDFVLLDEATSALDTHTERNIQAALSRVCANRTTLIIAHRLSTITHADEILVLKDGEIVERGNHETLLSKNGLYASMWNEQLESRNSNGAADAETPQQPAVEPERTASKPRNHP